MEPIELLDLPLAMFELVSYFVGLTGEVDETDRVSLARRLGAAHGKLTLGQPLGDDERAAMDQARAIMVSTRTQAVVRLGEVLTEAGVMPSSDTALACLEMAALIAATPMRRDAGSQAPAQLSRRGWLRWCEEAYDRSAESAPARLAQLAEKPT